MTDERAICIGITGFVLLLAGYCAYKSRTEDLWDPRWAIQRDLDARAQTEFLGGVFVAILFTGLLAWEIFGWR